MFRQFAKYRSTIDQKSQYFPTKPKMDKSDIKGKAIQKENDRQAWAELYQAQLNLNYPSTS